MSRQILEIDEVTTNNLLFYIEASNTGRDRQPKGIHNGWSMLLSIEVSL